MKNTDYLRLSGSSILITGASSGIGRAAAIAASAQGARVALVARRAEQLDETLGMLEGEGHIALPSDLGDYASIPALLRRAADALGPLSGLVHAAGVHAVTPLLATTPSRVTGLFEANVTTSVMLAKAFRSPKVRAEAASIVFMSSAVGLTGEAGVSAYAASKAAVAALGRSLGLELASDGIRVNSIAAGIVHTPLTDGIRSKVGAEAWAAIERAHPLGLGTPEDVAAAALFLVSSASKWVTGTTLVIDGGYTAH